MQKLATKPIVYATRQEVRAFEQLPKPGRAHLSRLAIKYHLQAGNIVISPYKKRDLKTTSYDVRLGPHHFRETRRESDDPAVLNPFDESHIRRYWGDPCLPVNAGKYMDEHGVILKGIRRKDQIIILAPGETILAHTQEFIGGRSCVSTEMRARSSMGRIGITICKCAGWGDLGYISRWTMEITNHMRETSIILVVGMRVAQIIFFQVDPDTAGTYAADGKYQNSDVLDEIVRSWTPEMMLPKLYRDYETQSGFPAMNNGVRTRKFSRRRQ
jgi:dCTP deaminase